MDPSVRTITAESIYLATTDIQTSEPVPTLADLITILGTASYSPSTLKPPADPVYPSTSSTAAHEAESTSSKPTNPNLVPVFIEIPADLLTPVAAYLKVANGSKHSFLLESVVGGEALARYSFVGAGKSSLTGEQGVD
jgi:anthranilate synthase component 1